MWKMALLTLLVLVAVMVFLFRRVERADPSLAALPGYGIYNTHCVPCHGGDGSGPKASRIAARPVSLVSSAFRDTLGVEEVVEVVTRGKGKMKGFEDRLTEPEIETVARLVLAMPLK
jgi:mono/diheme cytochrome c family protein